MYITCTAFVLSCLFMGFNVRLYACVYTGVDIFPQLPVYLRTHHTTWCGFNGYRMLLPKQPMEKTNSRDSMVRRTLLEQDICSRTFNSCPWVNIKTHGRSTIYHATGTPKHVSTLFANSCCGYCGRWSVINSTWYQTQTWRERQGYI